MRWSVALVWLVCVGCAASLAEGGAEPHAARIAAASEAHDAALASYNAGMVPLSEACDWSVRWYEAMHEAGDTTAARAHLARMEKLASAVEQRVAAGAAPGSDRAAMRYFVAEAKVWQLRP